jgi:predicted TIM-barrel fold metal-dependent hydrolase
MAQRTRPGAGPIVDCNVHLRDQRDNPVFWLSDRTLVRDMIGDYSSLPDRYILADYRRETAGHDVRGVVWSDAGAADPLAAAGNVATRIDAIGTIFGDWTLTPDPSLAARGGRPVRTAAVHARL